MRPPRNPPDEQAIRHKLTSDPARGAKLFFDHAPTVRGQYVHWDKLLNYTPPDDLTREEWWFAIKQRRRALFKEIPLRDKGGQPFRYLLVDPIPEQLHKIDLGAGGMIGMPDQITNPDTRDQYYVSSLIEEAITSSQLEGATTTRPIAKELIKSGRPPRDRSERMILNNFLTMRKITELKTAPLTPELVFDLHRLVTHQTLDDPTAAGRFRRPDERIVIGDEYGEVFHDPPPAAELDERLHRMCEFANESEPFIHPAIRSIILHFWLAYDHPFVDGNGRTARALFYWSMLRRGYWLCEFLSISHIILKAPVKYGMAFLYTETDENDLTYFILYHLGVIERAVEELHGFIQRKTRRLQAIEAELRGIGTINHRQRALVAHALRHPNQRYTIQSHRVSHNVVYQTARTDLLDLVERGLLSKTKIGKKWYFTSAPDLEARLARLE